MPLYLRPIWEWDKLLLLFQDFSHVEKYKLVHVKVFDTVVK